MLLGVVNEGVSGRLGSWAGVRRESRRADSEVGEKQPIRYLTVITWILGKLSQFIQPIIHPVVRSRPVPDTYVL